MADLPFDQSLETRAWEPRSETPIRFAVVGLGFFSREVAIPAIQTAPSTELSVLVTGSPDDVEAGAFGELEGVISYEEFDDGALENAYDAVYIATPNRAHLPAIETAAVFGKDVLCEKPLEGDAKRAEEAIAACKESGVGLLVGYRMQFDPAVRHLRGLLDRGVIGDLSVIEGGFTFPTLSVSGPDAWRLDRSLAGGGALADLGVYPINTSRYVTDTEPTAVSAMEASPSTAFDGITDPDGTGVEENVGVVLEFDGAIGSFTASFNAEKSSRLQFVGTDGRLELSMAFEVDTERTITYVSGDKSGTWTPKPINEVVEMFEYFAANVDEPSFQKASGRDGLQDLTIVDGAYEAIRERKTVPLTLRSPTGQ